MGTLSRRDFLTTSGAAAAGGLITGPAEARKRPTTWRGGPVAVASRNGLNAVKLAVERMQAGVDPLEAAIAGVNLVEEDPNDTSVGYGGLPNEEGIVELDSAVMHGPTYRAGSVASLRNIKYPSKVAYVVMRRTDHVMLVGEGALRFARAHGFPEENLLTERARKAWLDWKSSLSDRDDWLTEDEGDMSRAKGPAPGGKGKRDTGTIHLSARDAKGDLGCVTTTSGLAFKIPGRIGDSPIIGAGLYCDNEAGSAGSTGRGEAVILSCGSHTIVELMARGMHPKDACLEVVKRIAERTKQPHLLGEDGRVNFSVNFYAVDKQGQWGGATIYGPAKFAVASEDGARLEDLVHLYTRRR